MTTRDQRTHHRINSLNLLNYVQFDEDDNAVRQGMGRTLNVSESGILLETHVALDLNAMVLLTIGLEEDLVDVRGEVLHSKPGEEEKYEAGIRFIEPDETAQQILQIYVKMFKEMEE
ncbi:MAG: PilZ domain-containing protein [Deltaproteobacteria bacterium]|nr:PilZ domain-containing protein [Deltaproteobacteria bacterium]MBW2192886.1 PilZ domain-containing protein [Deltaproteobacteria bacterium]